MRAACKRVRAPRCCLPHCCLPAAACPCRHSPPFAACLHAAHSKSGPTTALDAPATAGAVARHAAAGGGGAGLEGAVVWGLGAAGAEAPAGRGGGGGGARETPFKPETAGGTGQWELARARARPPCVRPPCAAPRAGACRLPTALPLPLHPPTLAACTRAAHSESGESSGTPRAGAAALAPATSIGGPERRVVALIGDGSFQVCGVRVCVCETHCVCVKHCVCVCV